MTKGQKIDQYKVIIKDASGQLTINQPEKEETKSPEPPIEKAVGLKVEREAAAVKQPTSSQNAPVTPKKRSRLPQFVHTLPLILLAVTVVAVLAVTYMSRSRSEAGGQNIAQGNWYGSVWDNGIDAEDSQSGSGSGQVYAPGAYDSADTAVLVSRNAKDRTLTFLNLDSERTYTLTMDGTTSFYDKYGSVLSLNQVKNGDVVDITFLKEKKHLTSLKLSLSAWTYNNVDMYEIDSIKNQISIGSDVYKLTSGTLYFSENNLIELMDLNPTDILSFQGVGKQILSVTVEKGHGYLRLKNDENFIGGWIEVGQSMICKITEDMLLAVPEGDFEIVISHRGGGGRKNVTIYRDEETTLDIGGFEIPAPKSGQVLFSVSPGDAELYIDGALVDASAPVTLEYGLHQLIARAEGYLSITRYIRVAQPSVGINVTLDLVGSGEQQEENEDEEATTTDYYKVYVDAPVGAEVYVDGNYIGVAPCSFKKKEGTYVIILRKSGYATRSYTVNIDDSEKDLSYSFADLVENP